MVRACGLKSCVLITAVLVLFGTGTSRAATIGLQNATATFSQSGHAVSQSIDGSFSTGFNGWAIAQADLTTTNAETAVFETVSDLGTAAGTILTFTLSQLHTPTAFHTIGRLRLSVTTDNRAAFADGLSSGGDVTANWTILTPSAANATGGATLSILGDSSILASGTNPETSIYTVTAFTGLIGITGFRLETMLDPSLPSNGPGRQPTNGNFVLTEFEIDAIAAPEPSSLALSTLGMLGLVGGWKRSRKARRIG